MAISITFHHLLWPLLFSEPGRWQEHMCSRVQGTPNVRELQRTLRAWSYLIVGISRERHTSSRILFCCIVGVFSRFFFSYKVAKA